MTLIEDLLDRFIYNNTLHADCEEYVSPHILIDLITSERLSSCLHPCISVGIEFTFIFYLNCAPPWLTSYITYRFQMMKRKGLWSFFRVLY